MKKILMLPFFLMAATSCYSMQQQKSIIPIVIPSNYVVLLQEWFNKIEQIVSDKPVADLWKQYLLNPRESATQKKITVDFFTYLNNSDQLKIILNMAAVTSVENIVSQLAAIKKVMERNTGVLATDHEILYLKNTYDDVYIFWQLIGLKAKKNTMKKMPDDLEPLFRRVTSKLTGFVQILQARETVNSFRLKTRHKEGEFVSCIKRAGFTFSKGDDDEVEWAIYLQGKAPVSVLSHMNARVLLIKDGQVLVIQEKGRPHALNIPGGTPAESEFIIDTARRELREEIGITVQQKHLTQVAQLNRLLNPTRSSFAYYYISDTFSGDLNLQKEEIDSAFWVPLTDLATQNHIKGLSVTPFLNVLAKHILERLKNERVPTQRIILPDFRQLRELSEKDPNDVMVAELF